MQFKLDNPEFQIEIDTSLIEQVLINMILTAVEAYKNIKNPLIKISDEKSIEGIAIIKVSDNGLGIPDDILDNIFMPFLSTYFTQ